MEIKTRLLKSKLWKVNMGWWAILCTVQQPTTTLSTCDVSLWFESFEGQTFVNINSRIFWPKWFAVIWHQCCSGAVDKNCASSGCTLDSSGYTLTRKGLGSTIYIVLSSSLWDVNIFANVERTHNAFYEIKKIQNSNSIFFPKRLFSFASTVGCRPVPQSKQPRLRADHCAHVNKGGRGTKMGIFQLQSQSLGTFLKFSITKHSSFLYISKNWISRALTNVCWYYLKNSLIFGKFRPE